jgi:LacI family transcriptional regulator
MRDVAALAGVSQSTVSFVVNDRRDMRIPDETRAKVQRAIEELGFRPNLAARGLRLQRTHTIGFITDEIASSPFAGQTVLGAQDAAWKNGRLLILVNTGGDPEVEATAVDALLDRQVDGLIYAAMSVREIQPPLKMADVPSVLVNCFAARSPEFPVVLPRDARGGSLATQAALDAGHRRIVYLSGPKAHWATQQRSRGFRDVLRRAGVEVTSSSILEGDFHIESGYRRAREAIERSPMPTALICGNDRMALGAMYALQEAGLRVPEDVSVVGYDDQEELAGQAHPPLTTVTLPHYEMGRLGVESLLALAGGASVPRRQQVGGRLIVRDSLGPPRADTP